MIITILTKEFDMRTVKQIESDIAKLKVELNTVKSAHKQESAVHILSNLGWTYSDSGWVKPKFVATCDDYAGKSPYREGDFVNCKDTVYRVFRVCGATVLAQEVKHANRFGLVVSPDIIDITPYRKTPMSKEGVLQLSAKGHRHVSN